MREEALQAAQSNHPEALEHCFKPADCPCPDLCHPGLPDFSIYDIPRISKDKILQLEALGVRAASEIPLSFPLTDKQQEVADLARLDAPYVDTARIQAELQQFEYPLYFLDYETCGLAIPLYEGYKPYQNAVFQYSLHRLDQPGAELMHFEHLSTDPGDPTLPLLASLKANIGGQGTVIVWNAAFEKTRNTEMALFHLQYADFLQNVNNRIYDLMELVSKGHYIHPGFKGSCSIKHVLPVMVPELSYADLEINNGTKASLGWWKIMFGELDAHQKEAIGAELLEYCKLDTLAMVKIFQEFSKI